MQRQMSLQQRTIAKTMNEAPDGKQLSWNIPQEDAEITFQK